MDDSGTKMRTVAPVIADGNWHHIFVEVDRDNDLNVYLNREAAALDIEGSVPKGSFIK